MHLIVSLDIGMFSKHRHQRVADFKLLEDCPKSVHLVSHVSVLTGPCHLPVAADFGEEVDLDHLNVLF